MTVQQYCLRWNNHQPNFISVFSSLLSNQSLVDVTLAAEGKHLQAHKVVLSACSSYFQSLFTINPCKHPIVILKDVKFLDLKVMVDFMYHGEVNVSQEQLPCILKTAEMLKIKGLTEIPVDQSATRSSEKCEIPPQEENWSFNENVRISSPPSPSGRRKRLKKNICPTGSESEGASTSNEILLGTVENLNVIGTILKSESDRYNPTENTQHTHHQISTPPQKCNGLTVPIVQQPGPSHEVTDSDPTHHVSLQVTPHDLNTPQTVDCSPLEIPRITTTQQTTTGIQWNILDQTGYTHYSPAPTEMPNNVATQFTHNHTETLNPSSPSNHIIVNSNQNTEYNHVNSKRKRSINPQGDENFIRALDAVRFGGIGFCKAARMYGVNNRTLWLEYKKRGYPNFRLSIKNRNQAQSQLQSVEIKETTHQEQHVDTPNEQPHFEDKLNNQMTVGNGNLYDPKHIDIKEVIHRKYYDGTDSHGQTMNFQTIQLEQM